MTSNSSRSIRMTSCWLYKQYIYYWYTQYPETKMWMSNAGGGRSTISNGPPPFSHTSYYSSIWCVWMGTWTKIMFSRRHLLISSLSSPPLPRLAFLPLVLFSMPEHDRLVIIREPESQLKLFHTNTLTSCCPPAPVLKFSTSAAAKEPPSMPKLQQQSTQWTDCLGVPANACRVAAIVGLTIGRSLEYNRVRPECGHLPANI